MYYNLLQYQVDMRRWIWQGAPKLVRPQTHGYNFVKSWPIFGLIIYNFISPSYVVAQHKWKKISKQKLNNFTERFLTKFAANRFIKNPTTLCIRCRTTLWNIIVRKQVINDKLQRSVATYLRCGGLLIANLRTVYC